MQAEAMSIHEQSNVVEHPSYVYGHILTFLNSQERSSKNTAIKFKRDIESFFKFVRNKKIQELTMEDLRVTNREALDYQGELCKHHKNSVVNNAFVGVRSLYRYLKKNDFNINPDAVAVGRLPDDSKVIGSLHHDEVMTLAKLALAHEKHHPVMKSCLIYVAYGTSMRADALLNIKYRDIRQDENDPNEYWIEPEHLDKGKKIKKSIHVEAIRPILKMKIEKEDDDLVFPITHRSLNNMIKRLVELAGIDSRRNISFHSLRKAGLNSAVKLSNGNLFVATAQGDWKSPATIQKHYIESSKNIMGMAAFEEVDHDIYDSLTREEAIQLLKTLDGDILEVKLKRKAKKIIEDRVTV